MPFGLGYAIHLAIRPSHPGESPVPADQPAGCLTMLLRLLGLGSPTGTRGGPPFPYRRRQYLLSKAEASFFGVLSHVAADRYLLFAKVRLADLLLLPGNTPGRQSALNRVTSKHVDFVLCHRDGLRPCLAIELDDRSHDRPDRAARDDFLVQTLATAGLPLLRVPAARTYSTADLRTQIEATIATLT